MADSSFYLYTSVGCHLCEKAESLLENILGDAAGRMMTVEISDSDDLIASYGLRIPVLGGNSAGGEWHELGWPFGEEEVREFLAALEA